MPKTLPAAVLFLLLILISLPATSELFKPGYFTNHDGEGHIIRLQEFHIALQDGHFPPRLSKNLMYGYGYYFFNFNYPLVHWAGELFHLAGLGFVDSVKAVNVLGLVLSGLAMFAWQRAHWGNGGGFVAGVLYMYAPYRLLNIYVRGSLAEHLAFIMLPLLFMFTERIVEGKPRKRLRYILFGGISYGLLMLSHNIMALIFTLVLGFFMLFHLLLYRSVKNVISFGAVGITGLALSAFFWVPSIFEKKYVRLDQTIGQDYPDHFVFPHQLIQRSWGFGGSGPGLADGMSFQIGIFHAGFALLALFALPLLWRRYKKRAWHVIFYLAILFISVFFMLEQGRPLWDNLPLLRFTQFPWRFLSWSVFAASVLGGALFFLINKKLKNKVLTIMVFFLLLGGVIYSNKEYWQANQRINITLPGNQPISGSTTWADEQFPVWFEPKPVAFPAARVEVAEGDAQIEIESWKTAKHTYTVRARIPVKLIENTAYYPGWQLLVNGSPYGFSFMEERYPGRIVYSLHPGEYAVTTVFRETPLRKTVNLISLFAFVAVLLLLVRNLRQTS